MRRLLCPVLRLHYMHGRCLIFKQSKAARALVWQPIESLSHYSVKDKLQKLASLGKKLTGRITPGSSNHEESKLYQNVTPVIHDMVQSQTSLASMVFVSRKLVRKMTLSDKIVILDLLTEKLYHDIADKSPIFTRSPRHELIQCRLSVEGSLDQAVEPLKREVTDFIKGIVSSADMLNSHQLLSLFSNLQLLNWPQDSSEVAQIVAGIHGLDFKNLKIQEVLLYINAYTMYRPDTYIDITKPLVYEWYETNEINMSESGIFDLLEILSFEKYHDQDQEKVHMKVLSAVRRQVEIEELSLMNSVSLMVFCDGLVLKDLIEVSDDFYRKVKWHVRQNISEMRDEDVYIIHSLILSKWWESFQPEHKEPLRQKCLEMLKKDHLKLDVFLFYYLLSFIVLEHPEKSITIKLHEQIMNVLKHIDLCGMQVKLLKFLPTESEVNLILQRLKFYAKSNSGAEIHCGNILFLLPIPRVNMDDATLIRDNFLEAVMRKSNCNTSDAFFRRGLSLCFTYIYMTPTSIEFIEKSSFSTNIKGRRLILTLQKMKKEALEYPDLKRQIKETDYSRSQFALCRIHAQFVKNICQNYEFRKWAPFSRLRVSFSLEAQLCREPMLQILATEKIKELLSRFEEDEKRNHIFRLYSCSLSDPEEMFSSSHITEYNEINKSLLIRLLVEYFSLGPESLKDKMFVEIKSFVESDKGHVQGNKEHLQADKGHVQGNKEHLQADEEHGQGDKIYVQDDKEHVEGNRKWKPRTLRQIQKKADRGLAFNLLKLGKLVSSSFPHNPSF